MIFTSSRTLVALIEAADVLVSLLDVAAFNEVVVLDYVHIREGVLGWVVGWVGRLS